MSKKIIYIFVKTTIFICMAIIGLASCGSDNNDIPSPVNPPISPQDTIVNHRTLFMYFPWSGNSNPLTRYFWNNIQDMKKAYVNSGIKDQQVIVFIQTSGTEGVMFNLSDYRGYTKDSLALYKHYTELNQTTVEGIARILTAMKTMAPADSSYAMTIGCHGLGWIPTSLQNVKAVATKNVQSFIPHWNYSQEDGVTTRFFGGSSTQYQTNISTLAEAIESVGMKMEYILFDDCYMSSVEVAYDLRQITNYVIGCPTEVMGDGMPYAKIGQHLLGKPNYQAIVDGFVEHYSKSSYPYGTIGITRCGQLDSLAHIMKEIHSIYPTYQGKINDIQRMDGYTPILFFDMGDYVDHLCPGSLMCKQFNELLARTVPYKGHTGKYPTVMSLSEAKYVGSNIYVVPIHAYSGITTSEPSVNDKAILYYQNTSWYQATH